MTLAPAPVVGSDATMTFEVDEDWSLADLVSFLQAVDRLYQVMVAALIANDIRDTDLVLHPVGRRGYSERQSSVRWALGCERS
jgi:hypothetical protein